MFSEREREREGEREWGRQRAIHILEVSLDQVWATLIKHTYQYKKLGNPNLLKWDK